jgi:hypothetical protein
MLPPFLSSIRSPRVSGKCSAATRPSGDIFRHLHGERLLLSSTVPNVKTRRMTMPATPSTPNPAGDDRNLVAVDATTAVSFEDKLHLFWQKYRGAVLGLCALILVGILAKGGYEYMQAQKNQKMGQAYAEASTTDQLKSFAAANADHPLSGVAHLRIADEAYAAGKSADAIASYEKAAGILKSGPLGARAQLGRALAKVQGGKAPEGTKELQQLVNDTNQFKAIRTEAGYHLTSLSVEAGNAADAQKYSDQLMQIDPASPWTQRGLQLRATLPAPAEKPATDAAPAANQKKDDGAKVEVKLPGK